MTVGEMIAAILLYCTNVENVLEEEIYSVLDTYNGIKIVFVDGHAQDVVIDLDGRRVK